MATVDGKNWVSVTAFAISAAAISIAAAIFSGNPLENPNKPYKRFFLNPKTLHCPVSSRRRKCERLASRVRELEHSLGASIEKAASERRGRVRAQKVPKFFFLPYDFLDSNPLNILYFTIGPLYR